MTTADVGYHGYFVWAIATVVCWGGALISDLGFTDIAVASGATGLLFWIPSLAAGAFGIWRLPTQRSRWVGGLVTMSVPFLVVARWLVQIV